MELPDTLLKCKRAYYSAQKCVEKCNDARGQYVGWKQWGGVDCKDKITNETKCFKELWKARDCGLEMKRWIKPWLEELRHCHDNMSLAFFSEYIRTDCKY